MWRRPSTPKNPKATGGRGIVYYVYDIRTTMTDFCASFSVRKHADEWGKTMFGEHAYVSDRRLHKDGCFWNGEGT
jgi:hypothetical protein